MRKYLGWFFFLHVILWYKFFNNFKLLHLWYFSKSQKRLSKMYRSLLLENGKLLGLVFFCMSSSSDTNFLIISNCYICDTFQNHRKDRAKCIDQLIKNGKLLGLGFFGMSSSSDTNFLIISNCYICDTFQHHRKDWVKCYRVVRVFGELWW